MKKCMLILVAMLLSLTFLLPQSQVVAQENTDFPYKGYYLTEENRMIQGFVFDDASIMILLRPENQRDDETKNTERLFELLNNYQGLTGMIDPTMDADEFKKWQEENLNLPDYAQIYTEVAAQITPEMTRQDIDALIDAQDPHIDFANVHHNFNAPSDYQFITLHAPTIERSQDLWLVKIQTQRILRFEYEEDSDGETITDDYGVTYTKSDTMP